MIRILIADDHYLIREGFTKLLKSEIDMSIVGQVADSGEVIDFVRDNECDVLVLDLNMPGLNSLDLVKLLKDNYPSLKVLILTMQPEDRYAIRLLKYGAFGYITKESAPEELVKAIRKVNDGRKYISETLAEKLAYDLSSDIDKLPHELLSTREFQVFQLIASGKSMNAITVQLSLSLSTVNTYRMRILEKMNMSTNAEIITYAVKNGLID